MPTNSRRPDPVIPDHEVLRKVGGGAYGEVWLARGVTGALRAVKVLWREDFEDERSFEREFEGIQSRFRATTRGWSTSCTSAAASTATRSITT
jgi:hypothetical protein